MKKTLLFLSIISICAALKAQSFAPIGATWYYTEGFFLNGNIDYLKLESVKDTTINNVVCKKLEKRHHLIGYYGFKELFVHSIGDSVYFYEPILNDFQLLYDFSATTGDSWVFEILPDSNFVNPIIGPDSIKIIIDSIGQMVVNSDTLQVQYVSYYNKSHHFLPTYLPLSSGKIIKGIGDNHYLTNFWAYSNVVVDGNHSEGIRCYQDPINGQIQFTNDSCNFVSTFVGIEETKKAKISVYPNPVKEKLTIKGNEFRTSKFQINNVLGKRVLEGTLSQEINVTDFPNGIYLLSIINEEGSIIHSLKFVKN